MEHFSTKSIHEGEEDHGSSEMTKKNEGTLVDFEIHPMTSNSKPMGSHNALDPLQILVHEKLKLLPLNPHNPQNSTIFRVPSYFRAAKKSFYEPKLVSIGPYYHGKENLKSMEEYKWRCLGQFLQRNSEFGMDFYIQEMRLLEKQVRRCYSESITHIKSDDFVLMLLLDGCFILEYFFNNVDHSKENDRIFDSGWGETIKSDLLLLENQIPFFVIHKLICILQGPDAEHSEEECVLVDLLLRFFPYLLETNSVKPSCHTVDHLLHLLHMSIVPVTPHSNNRRRGIKVSKEASFKTRISSWLRNRHWRSDSRRAETRLLPKTIPCASELHEAGVTFFCKRGAKNMFDVTFHNGVIEMPLLIINDSTRTTFTNIIAFEQTQPSSSRIFTSFAVLMDLLIDTSSDVVLLQRRHILVHTLRNEKEVAFFFNELADYSFLDHENHYFKDLIDQVQKYSNLAWHKYKARLMHDYFRNPWTSISVFAGIVLLGLTIVQTYYTVYSVAHA